MRQSAATAKQSRAGSTAAADPNHTVPARSDSDEAPLAQAQLTTAACNASPLLKVSPSQQQPQQPVPSFDRILGLGILPVDQDTEQHMRQTATSPAAEAGVQNSNSLKPNSAESFAATGGSAMWFLPITALMSSTPSQQAQQQQQRPKPADLAKGTGRLLQDLLTDGCKPMICMNTQGVRLSARMCMNSDGAGFSATTSGHGLNAQLYGVMTGAAVCTEIEESHRDCKCTCIQLHLVQLLA